MSAMSVYKKQKNVGLNVGYKFGYKKEEDRYYFLCQMLKIETSSLTARNKLFELVIVTGSFTVSIFQKFR